MKCVSCNINVRTEQGYSKFSCPSCKEHAVVRCEKCRKNSILYKCLCGFEGP